MRMTASMLLVLAGVCVGLSGCQCCALTEHYASLIDCISDHEHAMERFYHPELDLNRIGRPDWCRCPLNRALCPCVCDRIRPAPCGYVVCRETGVVLQDHAHHPDWSRSAPGDEESELAPPPPGAGLDITPPARAPGAVPPNPEAERAEKDLRLP